MKKEYIINNLYDFKKNNSKYFNALIFILEKYKDDYYKHHDFTLKYRDLFRILSEREREPKSATPEEYEEMEKDAYALKSFDLDAFEEFSGIIKKYVDMQGIGYNAFIKCIIEVAELVPCNVVLTSDYCKNCTRYLKDCNNLISEKEKDYLFIKYGKPKSDHVVTDCLVYLYEKGYETPVDFCLKNCPKFKECSSGNPGLDEFTLMKLVRENNINRK